MKHLELKSIAGHCKKVLYKGCLFVGFLAACGLASCSDDDESAAAPVFPELQSFSCNIGETKEFTFEANTNWTLESSELWCKLVSGENEGFVLTGSAGTQTVTIRATDEGATVDAASVAKLWLTMGMQRVAVGEVTRSALGRELKIYDMDGNELEYLTVGYEDFEPFKVKANYRFAVTGTPNWVEVEGGSIVGTSNQETQGGLQVIQDGTVEKYPVTVEDGEKIVFTAEDGKAFAEFPLVYAGMPATEIVVTAPSTNKYNWVVSLDGKTIMQEGSSGSSTTSGTSFVNKVPFTVKALNDDFEFVFLESGFAEGSLFEMLPENAWMRCENNKGEVSLYIEPYEPEQYFPETRIGYVLAFSREEYNSIKDNLEEILIEDGDVAYEYQQRNLVIQFTQKNIESSSVVGGQVFGEIVYTDANTYQTSPLESSLLNSGDRLNNYQQTYGVSSVLEVTLPSGVSVMNVKVSFSDNFVFSFAADALKIYDENGGTASSGAKVEYDFSSGDESHPDVLIGGLRNLSETVLTVITGGASSEGEDAQKVMVVVHPAKAEEGGVDEPSGNTPFSITGGTCTSYTSGSAGNADDLKSTYSCEAIYQITSITADDIIVALPGLGASITSLSAYNASNSFSTINVGSAWGDGNNITPAQDNPDAYDVYVGSYSNISRAVIFLVITTNDSHTYGLVIDASSR